MDRLDSRIGHAGGPVRSVEHRQRVMCMGRTGSHCLLHASRSLCSSSVFQRPVFVFLCLVMWWNLSLQSSGSRSRGSEILAHALPSWPCNSSSCCCSFSVHSPLPRPGCVRRRTRCWIAGRLRCGSTAPICTPPGHRMSALAQNEKIPINHPKKRSRSRNF